MTLEKSIDVICDLDETPHCPYGLCDGSGVVEDSESGTEKCLCQKEKEAETKGESLMEDNRN